MPRLNRLFGFNRDEAPLPPLFQPGDHYILRKLGIEVLRWMIGGRVARRQWFVVLASIYDYGGDAVAALAGLGIGAPFVAIFEGKVPEGQNALGTLRDALPGPWFGVGVAALLLWIGLRLVVKRQDAVARALYARDCDKAMQKLYAELWTALPDANPLPKITPLQEALQRVVDDAIDKNVWPWNPPQPRGRYLELELRKQIDEIRATFMAGWSPPPAGVI
jgi:hypothetical protein